MMAPLAPPPWSQLKAKQSARLSSNLKSLKPLLLFFSGFLLGYLCLTAPLYVFSLPPTFQEWITWGALPLALVPAWLIRRLNR